MDLKITINAPNSQNRKHICGSIISIICFLVFGYYQELLLGACFSIIYILVPSIEIKTQNNYIIYALNILWTLFGAICVWILSITMIHSTQFDLITLKCFFLNLLCILTMFGFVFLVTSNLKTSIFIGSFILLLFSTFNAFILHFRGKELCFLDFMSIKTAANIVSQYDIKISKYMITSWSLWVLYTLSLTCIPTIKNLSKSKARLIVLGILFTFIIFVKHASSDIATMTFYNKGTVKNGYYLNFILGIRDSSIDPPDNYSKENLTQLSKNYTQDDSTNLKETKRPNIIVIMEESYADFNVINDDFKTNKPVTPFTNSLFENTIKGYALTSVFGGNTPNSEFEFLTGNSMLFLPTNTIPYQQYLNNKTYSLPWLLKSYGYTTISTHPATGDNWSRNSIYPLLGFDTSKFIDDYPQNELVRDYVSDKEVFDHILKILNENKTNPLFLFGVTIQNHGGYTFDTYTSTIHIQSEENHYPEAEQYLSLLAETDSAKKDFIQHLESYPQDTIVLFFGDHFPQIESEFYQKLYGSTFDTLNEQMLQYKVPFTIWANFDIDEKFIECTSLNYLSNYLINAANLTYSPYNNFLLDMEKIIPSMNAMGYYSNLQNSYVPYNCASGIEKEYLDKYHVLQYNCMFDSEKLEYTFFEHYLN